MNEKINQKGFSLVELLIVVMILTVIAALAFSPLAGVRRGVQNKTQIARLRAVAAAESEYRKTNSDRKYGTLQQLCEQSMLAENVLPSHSDCEALASLEISGWTLVPAAESDGVSADYYKTHFGFELRFNRAANDKTPNLCVFEDATLRAASSENPSVCRRDSAPVE